MSRVIVISGERFDDHHHALTNLSATLEYLEKRIGHIESDLPADQQEIVNNMLGDDINHLMGICHTAKVALDYVANTASEWGLWAGREKVSIKYTC